MKTIIIDRIEKDGAVTRFCAPVQWFYIGPDEIERELIDAGFREIQIYGGFGRERLYDPALNGKGRQIILARS